MVQGPNRGNFRYPTKIILVASERNTPLSQSFLRGMGLRVIMESRYLRGFIGYGDYKEECVR